MNKMLSPSRQSKTFLWGLLIAGTILAGCQSKPATLSSNYGSTGSTTTTTTTINTPSPTVTSSSMQLQPAKTGDTIATIETDKGTIKLKVFTEQVPEIAKNFIELAKAGKYDGTPFHRIIEGFMIQTGDFTNQNGTGGHSYQGPDTSIDDQFDQDLQHHNGTVSMANSGPDSNGSQFFIVTGEQGAHHLDGRHSVFGQVIEGQDIVAAISKVDTGPMDKPITPIIMKKVTISTM